MAFRVAYVVSRFPSTTETFIAREMNAVERLGVEIELFALICQRHVVEHCESRPWLTRLRTAPLASATTLRAQWYWLRHRPTAYAKCWREAIRGNWRSLGFLLRACVVVPKAAQFARDAESAHVDHIHAHWATHPALAALVMHELTGAPFSFTAHAHDIFVNRTMLQKKIASASFVAVVSHFNAEFLAAEYGDDVREKLMVVRCGVETSRFAPSDVDRTSGTLRIVCVASLQSYKGHRVLIEALSILRARGQAFSCTLIGDGPERAAIEKELVARGLTDVVRLAGARTSDEVLAAIRSADVVALPSVVAADRQMEGIPVALMEALACETAVVASRLSGIPELIIHEVTGLLVEPELADALSDALERLAQDRTWARQLGARGREHVISEFSAETSARRLVECFASARAS